MSTHLPTERDLGALLAGLTVYRHDGVWAYEAGLGGPDAIFHFREREGACHIVPANAETNAYNRWVWLELAVYSDLNAVGFLAAVADVLARDHVPCNAIAALNHDHIFVPERLADVAVAAIESLASTF
ncbi:MAG: ACT domain-containing protein [Pseudomonadota bacterium]